MKLGLFFLFLFLQLSRKKLKLLGETFVSDMRLFELEGFLFELSSQLD